MFISKFILAKNKYFFYIKARDFFICSKYLFMRLICSYVRISVKNKIKESFIYVHYTKCVCDVSV